MIGGARLRNDANGSQGKLALRYLECAISESLEGSRFGARATIHRILYATSAAEMCAKQAAPANNPALSNSTGRAENK